MSSRLLKSGSHRSVYAAVLPYAVPDLGMALILGFLQDVKEIDENNSTVVLLA